MRAILLALVVLGATALLAPVADACSPCGEQCHVVWRDAWIVGPDGSYTPTKVPAGIECYY